MKRFTTLFLCFLITSSAAFASGVYDVNYDLDSGKVKIEGQAEKSKDVTLEILRAGKKEDDLKNIVPENADSMIFHYDQILADENGNFCFEFKLPESTGTDTYITRVAWGSKNYSSQLVYVSPTDFQNALASINLSADQSAMLSAINSGLKYLGYESIFYDALGNSQKGKIAKSVLDEKPAGEGYADAQAFGQSFKKALALQVCNQLSSQFTPIEATEYFEDILKLKDLPSYSTFNEQSEKAKAEIMKAAVSDGNGNYNSIAEFKNAFEKKTVVFAINSAGGYDKIEKVLKDNNHILLIDFSDYNALRDKTAVDKQMVNRNFSDISDVISSFNALVASAKLIPTTPDANASINGGGGGGGGPVSSLTPVQIQTGNTVSFNDIDNTGWAKQSIEKLAQRKIIQGKGNNKFEPDSSVTREEFITMLVSALNIKKTDSVCNFDDVDKDAWYYSFVASAVEANLVSGISANSFGSGLNITKQDIATLLVNAATLKGKNFEGYTQREFKDMNNISAYALEGVKKLSSVGIINGTDTGLFEPKKNASRAEAAVMLDRFLGFIE